MKTSKMFDFLTVFVIISCIYAPLEAKSERNCSEIFKLENDEFGKINTGFIHMIVPKKFVDTGFEMEVLFEIDEFPIVEKDLPKLEMIDNEATVLESIRSGEAVKYAVIFNLAKKLPKIVRVAVNDWSGFSPNIKISQIMCDESDGQNAPIFVLSYVFRPSRAKLPSFRCTMDYNFYFGYCGFHFNKTHPHITPLSDIPSTDVTKLYFGGESHQSRSKVHTLTSDFCQSFPNVVVYEAFGLGLVEIHKNSFKECLKLETIDLSHNNLTYLDADLFEFNTKLRGMFLGVNQLIKILPEMFRNTPFLEEIIFSYNKLTEFPIKFMREMTNLKKIYLHENSLVDLDEREVVKKFPNLKEILWMCPNRVNHERMDEIHEFFNALNITTEEKYCQARK